MKHNAMFRSAVIIGLLVLSAATVRAYDQTTSSVDGSSLPSDVVSRSSVRVNQIADYTSSYTATSTHAAAPLNMIYLPVIRYVSLCNDIEQSATDPIGNDDPVGAAQLTTIGKTCEGSLEDDAVGDDDYYWLDLKFGDGVTVDLTGIPEGANYDLYLYRYDPLKQFPRVAFSGAGSQADESITLKSTRTTRYVIRIHIKSKSRLALNTYSLRVVITLSTTPLCNDSEPNNDVETAKPITTVGNTCIGSFQNDSSSADFVVDGYWVDLAVNQGINIDLTDIPIGADYILYLVYGHELISYSNAVGQDEHIIYTASRAGRYYIFIVGYQKSSTADNNYALGVSLLAFCDPFEPNDDRFVNPAGPLISGQSYQAKICAGDSEDNYYFETTTNSQVQLRLILPSSLVGHTTIALYSIEALSSPLPDCYKDLVPLPNYVLSCSIPSPGRYIVRIYTDTVSDNDNAYTLEVSYN